MRIANVPAGELRKMDAPTMLAKAIVSIIPTITYLSAPQILSKRPSRRLSNSFVMA